MQKLNIDSNEEPILIGKITNEMLKLLGLSYSETGIVIWNDRKKYIEKHKKDFDSEEDWRKHVESIPEIVQNPDYIGLHPSNNSVQFIKKIDKHMLVGVRIKNKGNWAFRSSYPITEENLQNYIKCGTVKSVKDV